MFISSIVVFEVGSALCGAAPNMDVLIVGRIIAGLGGTGMYIGSVLYKILPGFSNAKVFTGCSNFFHFPHRIRNDLATCLELVLHGVPEQFLDQSLAEHFRRAQQHGVGASI